MTPLHQAADRGHVDTVRCLVEQGAIMNIKDEKEVSYWEYTADYKLYWWTGFTAGHLTKGLVSTAVECIAIFW